MIRNAAVLALVAVALIACGKSNPVGPVGVVGEYTLTSVNDGPIPAALLPGDSTATGSPFLLTRASIELRADQSYLAVTCYDFVPGNCTLSRHESGTYAVDGDVVSLTSGRYSRQLSASSGRLTQRGGGDFQCNDPAQRSRGVVCFVLVYSK